MTNDHKFALFKSKVQKLVEDQDYFSESERSASGDEDENQFDMDRAKLQIFFKKSLKMQKEGTINLLDIIRKE